MANAQHFMRAAIEMAEHALQNDETPVGCVFVHNNVIIAKGINDTNRSLNGTRHAEAAALEQITASHADWQDVLKETDLYVTVEPCIMCAAALRQYGIRTVYYGCANDKFGGTGGVLDIHKDVSIDPPYAVHGGIFRDECIMLLRRFYVQENEKAPESLRKKDRQLNSNIVSVNIPEFET